MKRTAALTITILLMIGSAARADDPAPWSVQQARLAVSGQFSTKSCGVGIMLGKDLGVPSDEMILKGMKREMLKTVEEIKVN